MLNFLKGNKIELTVDFDRADRVYAPGDTIQARISLRSEKELKLRGGRLVVICQERYQYRQVRSSTDSDGNTSSSVDTEWKTNENEVFRFDFLPETSLHPGTSTYQTRYNLPPDALPTCEGETVSLRWRAKATLDRRLMADINAEVEFCVPSSAPYSTSPSGIYGTSNEPGEAELAFELPHKEFITGDPLAGCLNIMPNKTFAVSEIRLELVRWDHVPDVADSGYENGSETTVLTQKLAGKMHLQAGQPLELPFEAVLPEGLPPSAQLAVGALGYELRGILARPLRKDTRVVETVFVYNRPAV